MSPPQQVRTPGTRHEKALLRIESAEKSRDIILDFMRLGLEEVPETLAQCTMLKALFLSLNPLERAPESILSLKQLEVLYRPSMTAAPPAEAPSTTFSWSSSPPGKGCSPDDPRSSWTKQIKLITTADYGVATSGARHHVINSSGIKSCREHFHHQ